MAGHPKDNWAKALAAMSEMSDEPADMEAPTGEAPGAPDQAAPAVSPAPRAPQTVPAPDAAADKPVAPGRKNRPSRPPAPPSARPPGPVLANPASLPTPPAPTPPARSTAPTTIPPTPATPTPPQRGTPEATAAPSGTGASDVPGSRRVRPATPTVRHPVPAPRDPQAEADAIKHVVEADLVSAPAPDASVFVTKPKKPAPAQARPVDHQRLYLRRTLIPVLLTLGVGLPILGSIRIFASAESAFVEIGWWFTALTWSIGLVLLALAGLNMLAVRRMRDGSGR